MKKLKRLMLLTALCAIISCGSGGGSPEVSNVPTPITPGSPTPVTPGTPGSPTPPVTPGSSVTPPVVVNNTRYTTTPDITKLKEGIYDEVEYTQDGDNDSHNGFNTTIGAMKYGLKLDKVGATSIYPSTVMTVQKDGAVFWVEMKDGIGKEKIKNLLSTKINDGHNLSLDMKEGSNLLVVEKAFIALSDSDFSNILSEIPDTLRPKITGTGYNEVKFTNSELIIDEDINLDDDNNRYYKALQNIQPRLVILAEPKNLTGIKDGQVGIKASSGAGNLGTIKLTGKNTVALFSKKFIINKKSIEVGEDSIAQYTVYDNVDTDDRDNKNEGNITLGKTSTGIRMDREYNNIGGEAVNDNTGKILSTAEKVTGMMAYTADKAHSTGEAKSFEIRNAGKINLSGDRSTGMYVAGKGSTEMFNNGEIIMGDSSDRSNPSIGMFSTNSDNHGENALFGGTIEVGKNSIGMAGINGGELTNEGTIIIKGDGGIGMYLADGTEGINEGTIKTDGAGLKDVIGVIVGKDSKFKNNGTIDITSVNGKGVVFESGAVVENNGEIKVNGTDVSMEEVAVRPVTVKAMSNRIAPVKSDLGIYMNSLGKTNPIEGLSNLGLDSADLLIGAEATEKTNATEVAVGQDVLKPFNDSIHTSKIADWTVKSGSLVWEAEPEIKDNNIEKVSLKKQSYVKYADSEETKAVAEALDEKYVNTMAESKDKQIFNDMNKLRTEKELAKTYKEVSGGQYINVQQRINQTDEVLEKEITALRNNNLTEAGHHISTFAGKDNYEAKTPEIAKSKSVNYGAAYLYNDTNNGWGAYAGAVMNKFKLEDEGKSKENMTLVKAGVYKTFDLGPVDWTIGGEGNISWNEMKRRYVSLGTVYENKADYNSYGLAVKNELSKTYQLNDVFTFKPYGALKIGFGKFTDIKEKNSTLGLEIKGNSYYSVKPALGMELGLSVPVGTAAKFKAGLGLAYEHELGKIENNENEAKFISAGSSWKLKGAKDEERGGLKSELKAGFEAGNYNIYLTGGYNTKGKNSHVGIKFGASF